jgi:hypothetical protein
MLLYLMALLMHSEAMAPHPTAPGVARSTPRDVLVGRHYLDLLRLDLGGC